MSKDLKDITASVMKEIHQDKIKMRPKIYFIIGAILVFSSLILSSLSSVFLVGIIRFSLRSHGPMGQYRWEQIISSFPWWALISAALGLIMGLWLIRKYDFSYKINFKIFIVGFVLAIIMAGYLVDLIGINDVFYKKGYMNRVYRQNTGKGMMINNIN
ncbi:hypothetical protein JXE04_00135 [Patescibacteria group bacterium]|nr:hypothetical protein [Patescibacteria group bacterium]